MKSDVELATALDAAVFPAILIGTGTCLALHQLMTSPRAITALSGAALAGGIGVAAQRDSTMRINRAVRRRIHPRRSAPLRSVAKGISYLAGLYEHQLTMVHAKVIVADGCVTCVGSINFDPLVRVERRVRGGDAGRRDRPGGD